MAFRLVLYFGLLMVAMASVNIGDECRRIFAQNLLKASWNHTNSPVYLNVRSKMDQLRSHLTSLNALSSEGGVIDFEQEMLLYITMASNPCVKTICEIGFNAGHSALLWMIANPNATVVMFDLFEHRASPIGEAFIRSQADLHPGRLTIIKGDSTNTIPQFHSTNPGFHCDLLSVDGGHKYEVASADIKNMFFLANPRFNMVFIDDTNCDRHYCVDKAVADAAARGILTIHEGIQMKGDNGRGISLGTYHRNPLGNHGH